MFGHSSYLPLDDILSPAAENMIAYIGEDLDDNCATQCANSRSFRTMKTGFQSLNGSFKRGLSDSSDTLKSSLTVLLVSFPITSKVLWLMRMWLGYTSMITWWIIQLQALWPIGSVHAAAQLQISHCEDGMHWLNGCSRICIVGGYFLALWRVDRWVIIWSLLMMLWVSFWCFVYFIITSFIFMHEGLCWQFTMLGLIVERFVSGKGIVTMIRLCVWVSCNW